MFEDPFLPSHSENLLRSPAERRAQQWQFARVLNLAALIYVFLHKFFIPFILYSLGSKTEFRVIDWWWVYHAVLALTLNRKNWNDVLLRVVLGFGFGGLIVQSYDALMAEAWPSFSLWLTTAGSCAVLLYVTGLMPKGSKYSLMQGLCGSLAGFLLMGTITIWLGMDRYALTAKPIKQELKQAVPRLDKAKTCGAQKFSLALKSDKVVLPGDIQVGNQLFVKDCGFSVALQQIDPAQLLEVINQSASFLNIRVNHLIGQRWQPLTNRPLRLGETLQINLSEFPTDTLWILESDARPQAGLIVLFSDAGRLQEKLKSLGISDSIVFSRDGIVGGD